ncbi:JAB domain-containing protein [Butyricimonas synergistica]|uniref:JAB domain-containing protein n=1 Tax=Butyricimonas synergistica TaxID=544644 RepID=UPI00037DA0C4|nr:JAB domain-containing protein [Butyricimonas synergistica]
METKNEQLLKVAEVELSYKTTIKAKDRIKINDANDVYTLSKQLLGNSMEHHEEVYLIMLNNSMKVLGVSQVSKGGTNQTIVDPKIILQLSILSNASKVILIHNHPSGGLKPSWQDDNLTKTINKIMTLLEIPLIDHVIVTAEGYYSYCDKDRIDILNKTVSTSKNSSPFIDLNNISWANSHNINQ